MTPYDVIVVGAGPAGSTAARLLAEKKLSVLLLDKKDFPRDKICAGWLNARAVEDFPYLKERMGDFVEARFYGVTFYKGDMSRSASYTQEQPAGYVTLRTKLDACLKDLAVDAGADFRAGCAVTDVTHDREGVTVRCGDGMTHRARILVGADGVSSVVARKTRLNHGWQQHQLVICVNEDIPCPAAVVKKHFGEKPLAIMSPAYSMIVGYGWVFPKREHICVGIGGRVNSTKNVALIFSNFFEDLRRLELIPRDLRWSETPTAMDPAGAAANLTPEQTFAEGRVLLVGDAGGFSCGSSGEGIYPGMLSAKLAAESISAALQEGDEMRAFLHYKKKAEESLLNYVRGAVGPGLVTTLSLMYGTPRLAEKVARSYLFGEPLRL